MVAVASIEGDEIVYDFIPDDDDEGDYGYRALPDEVVIRELLDLDLDDADAIVAFVEAFGVINRPYSPDTFDIPTWIFENERVGVADVRGWLSRATLLAKHYVAARHGAMISPRCGTPLPAGTFLLSSTSVTLGKSSPRC